MNCSYLDCLSHSLYCCVFGRLVVLAVLSVLSHRLARKAPLSKPLASRGDCLHKDQVEEWYIVCIVICCSNTRTNVTYCGMI